MNARSFIVLPALALLAGCAPAERIQYPADWQIEWEGRSLWATPNAYIYATHGAAAGEVDRLAARVKSEYSAELGQPTPPVLIIVRDAGEPLPGDDLGALLRCTLRMEIERTPAVAAEDEQPGAPTRTIEAQTDEALTTLAAAGIATGCTLEVLAGSVPLTCDARGLRAICRAPDGPSARECGAVILPTLACLRAQVRRMMRDALKMYGIGPVAQMVFAPVLAMVEAKTVDRLDRLREAALFEHWLFEHADVAPEQKYAIASERRERWGGSVEAAAASVASAADAINVTTTDDRPNEATSSKP